MSYQEMIRARGTLHEKVQTTIPAGTTDLHKRRGRCTSGEYPRIPGSSRGESLALLLGQLLHEGHLLSDVVGDAHEAPSLCLESPTSRT